MIFSKYLVPCPLRALNFGKSKLLLKSSKQSTCFLTWNNFSNQMKINEKNRTMCCVCLCRLDSRLLLLVQVQRPVAHTLHSRDTLLVETGGRPRRRASQVVPSPFFSDARVFSASNVEAVAFSLYPASEESTASTSTTPPFYFHVQQNQIDRRKTWSQRSEFA